jgi:hypothetical protein
MRFRSALTSWPRETLLLNRLRRVYRPARVAGDRRGRKEISARAAAQTCPRAGARPPKSVLGGAVWLDAARQGSDTCPGWPKPPTAILEARPAAPTPPGEGEEKCPTHKQ